jgi:LPXTG-motif cell wall-anchored protein
MIKVRDSWIRTGALLIAIILVCSFASAGSAVASPVGQAGTGTITGKVISENDVPLPNVKLAAFAQAPGTPDRVKLADVQSDARGQYSVQVPPGQVWMEFLTQDILGRSFWGYDNLPVNVVAGQTIPDQNFVVAIRVVSEPEPAATAVPAPTVAPPGMPTTGAGTSSLLLPAIAFGVMLMLLGLLQRRRARR